MPLGEAFIRLVSRPTTALALAAAIMAATFALDLWLPPSVATGIPYILAILLCRFLPWRAAPLAFAEVASILIIVGYYVDKPATDSSKLVLANQGLTMFAIWTVAVSLHLWLGVRRRLARMETEEERTRMVMREMAHRFKNVLAQIDSVAATTLAGASSLAEGAALLRSRIGAVARMQDLLLASGKPAASLREIISGQLEPYGSQRFRLEGPDVGVQSEAGFALAMTLHELIINAIKYGALSRDGGSVAIAWRIEAGRLVLDWREAGGPAVRAPEGRGFGRALIEHMLRHEVGGSTKLTFNPDGVRCRMKLPADCVVEAEPDGHRAPRAIAGGLA